MRKYNHLTIHPELVEGWVFRVACVMSYFVYILHCSDGSYYTGLTEDLEIRLVQHQAGEVPGYTKSRRPVKLVFSDEFSSMDDAINRERQIKGWSRSKKEALIAGDWEGLAELSRSRKDKRQ